eukprot:1151089-Pelagomonas_calceolata.AAC.5
MSLQISAILFSLRKPCPPQHSRHCCSVSTLPHVAAALRPELSTCTAFASCGLLLAIILCTHTHTYGKHEYLSRGCYAQCASSRE